MSTWRELSVCATKLTTYGMACGVTAITETTGGGRCAWGASLEQPAAKSAQENPIAGQNLICTICSPLFLSIGIGFPDIGIRTPDHRIDTKIMLCSPITRKPPVPSVRGLVGPRSPGSV